MAKHGWRYDRATHNYLYFVFYYPYVATLYYLFKYLAKYGLMPKNRPRF
jgi:hypothetical protein